VAVPREAHAQGPRTSHTCTPDLALEPTPEPGPKQTTEPTIDDALYSRDPIQPDGEG
jgi:hypothetical protein